MSQKSRPLVLYLCNGKNPKCSGINGCQTDCFHTADIEYAKSDRSIIMENDTKIFQKYITTDGDVQYWERRYESKSQ